MVYHNKPACKTRQFTIQILKTIFKTLWKTELQKEKHLKATAPEYMLIVYIIYIPSKSWMESIL